MGHAYVFSGQDIESLKSFANDFVKFINCKFPDVFVVASQNSKSSLKDGEDKEEIDIALIREAQNFLSYKSYYGGYKTVIIEHAERMNAEAQNCFLKSLEEPKGNALIILLSSKPDTLLPTIASRCQQIKFASDIVQRLLPEEKVILQDLLKVFPMDLAEKFVYAKSAALDAKNVSAILETIKKYFRHLLLLKIGAAGTQNKKDFTIPSAVLDKYSVLKIKQILILIEKISYQVFTTNANPKLALEIILLEL